MPFCKNNPKRTYTGKEPSPKGLGYCASGEKEGTIKKGKDGNTWIKEKGRWIKLEDDEEIIQHKLEKKLYDWWSELSGGNIIVIYKNGKNKLIKSKYKTIKAKNDDIWNKWIEFDKDTNVKAIIWSAQSQDVIYGFINFLIKKTPKNKLKKMLKIKNLPSYLLKNYKKYFEESKEIGNKDYHLRSLW
jgi:hypothetical protein